MRVNGFVLIMVVTDPERPAILQSKYHGMQSLDTGIGNIKLPEGLRFRAKPRPSSLSSTLSPFRRRVWT
jgi:hypothetical protein